MAILAIDEPSFQQLGQGWPFPRSLHARLIDRLREDGARAIGFDVVFADPAADPAHDAALAQAAVAARWPPVSRGAGLQPREGGQRQRHAVDRGCPCRPCAMPELSMATPVWSRTTTSWCAACPPARPLCGHSAQHLAVRPAPAPPQTLDRLVAYRVCAAASTHARTTRLWSPACCLPGTFAAGSFWWGARP